LADLGFGPRNLIETTPQQLAALSFCHPEMQETVLAAVETAGAEVRRGAVVQGIDSGGQPVVSAQLNGHTERIPARFVVAADGRGSAVRKCGFAVEKNVQPFLFAGVLLTDQADLPNNGLELGSQSPIPCSVE